LEYSDLSVSDGPPPGFAGIIEALAPEMAPRRAPESIWIARISLGVGGIYAGSLAAYLAFGAGSAFQVWSWPIMAVSALVTAAGGDLVLRRRTERLRRRFFVDLEREPWKYQHRLIHVYREKLREYESQVLGPGSPIEQARQPMLAAADEARKSLAYWQARHQEEGANAMIASNSLVAEDLTSKLDGALADLDRRRGVLSAFFGKCEARLGLLERGQRDSEESEKLQRLSETAGGLIHSAEATLAEIGRVSARQAIALGEALGAFERARLWHKAGEVPVEEIEHVADAILASSERDHALVLSLVRELS
jgi:hypothetical protein